ncbi:MAG: LCP family protein [Chloroflexota bacterium]
MKSSTRRWLAGLALALVLALIAVIAYWLLTAWGSFGGAATVNSPDLTPSLTPEGPSPTPSCTPSLTPLPTATRTSLATPTSVPSATPTHPQPTPAATDTPTPYPIPAPEWLPPPLTFLPGTPTPTPVVVTRTNAMSRTLTAPEPLPLVSQPDEAINILLLGSDQQGMEKVGRTDVIVIAAIYPEIPSVSLLSIPRDFYAWMPGRGFDKINTAFSHGGPALMEATIRYNLGIEIDYYARIGFESFIKIVDTLGGVTVAVECPLQDAFPDPSSPSGRRELDLQPGMHHLDGRAALRYTRSRWSTSDFDRHRRQQQVLRGLYRQALNVGVIPKIPSLWGALRESVSTDLDLEGLIRLGAIGMRLDPANVKSRFVGGGAVEHWTGPEGLYILLPNVETLQSVIAEALAPAPAPAQQEQQKLRVEIVDGTPNEGWEQVAAERLRWEGFNVVRVQPADEILPRTQIVDLRTTPSSWPLSRLMRLYGREGSDVISRPTEESDVHFQILLGADYDPCVAVRGP